VRDWTIAKPLLLIALLLAWPAIGQSQEKDKADRSREAMDRDMQNAKPGPPHAQLARLAGSYDTITKFVMEPGGKAVESSGTATIKTILDGRFLLEEDAGTFMGQPTSGMRLLGYNNASKQYEGVWTYTRSTAILLLTGTSKDGGKSIDFTATWDEEAGGRQTLEVSTRHLDKDHFVVELKSRLADGNAGPTLITTYNRRK
jgi:hypothetical protein